MVGYHMIASRCPKQSVVTARTQDATVRTNTLATTPLECDERAHALEAACIPSILVGTQWTWPSQSSINKLTAAAVRALFGNKRILKTQKSF